MDNIFAQDILVLRPGILVVSGAEADAVYNTYSKSVYRVNHVGGKVLRLCDGSHTLEDISKAISKESMIGLARVQTDVARFVEHCPVDWWTKDKSRHDRGSMTAFSEELDTEPLRRVSWECTNACNLRCVHCLVEAGTHSSEELSTSEASVFLRQLSDIGVKSITLTGGEATVRKDFTVLVRLIHDLGIELTLLSNGTMITKSLAKLLADANAKVQVTILGSRAEIHDTITGVPGSYDSAMRGIALLKQASVDLFDVSFVVLKTNINDLRNTREALAEFGLGVKIGLLLPVGRANANWGNIGIPAEVVKRLSFEETLHTETILQGFIGSPRFGTISCPTDSMTVDSNGKVIPCSGIRGIVLADIRRESPTDIWNGSTSPKSFLRNTSVENIAICSSCELRFTCMGGCRAVTFAYESSLSAKNPFCEMY